MEININIDLDNLDKETLKKIKDVLIDTYGTAMQYNPAAQADLIRIDTTDPADLFYINEINEYGNNGRSR